MIISESHWAIFLLKDALVIVSVCWWVDVGGSNRCWVGKGSQRKLSATSHRVKLGLAYSYPILIKNLLWFRFYTVFSLHQHQLLGTDIN